MRQFSQAADAWRDLKAVFQRYRSLNELRLNIRTTHDATSIVQDGLRSACWKAFLVTDTIDVTQWPKILASSRSAYNAVREHFRAEADLSIDLPPRQNDESTELRNEIRQDVERCMPDNLYFRQPETQMMLVDILYVFCRLNPDLSYRQGMHELLAPILWVVERDAIDLGPSSKAFGEDAVIRAVFDSDHVEHDTFTLFCQVMQSAKSFYEQTTHTAGENPMVLRSKEIFDVLLTQIDPELSHHLRSIDVVPQIFLMRWIRLLFGRELTFDQTLLLWDVIFAIDTSLELVNYISLLMLLRMRWQLLDADYTAALTLLLQSTQPPKSFNASAFALDALYLEEHPDLDGSSYLVLKYTNRAMQPPGRPNTPPALQRNITTFSGALNAIRSTPSPSRRTRQTRNIEAMLQSTAKNIYARSERLGIGKAVRSAVDEVHRKALEIREAREDAMSPSSTSRPLAKLRALEERQAQLAKLLNDAVTELWEYQKLATETVPDVNETESPSSNVEKLSMAIAKAQFVQVYLQDPSLPLPSSQEDSNTSHDSSNAQIKTAPRATSPMFEQPDPFSTEKNSTSEKEENITSTPEIPTASTANTQPIQPDPKPSRPPLSESSFSWMLGQNEDKNASTPPSKQISTPTKKLNSNTALFDGSPSQPGLTDSHTSEDSGIISSPNNRASRQRPKRQEVMRKPTSANDDPFGASVL